MTAKSRRRAVSAVVQRLAREDYDADAALIAAGLLDITTDATRAECDEALAIYLAMSPSERARAASRPDGPALRVVTDEEDS